MNKSVTFGAEVEKGNLLQDSPNWESDVGYSVRIKKARKNNPLSLGKFYKFGITYQEMEDINNSKHKKFHHLLPSESYKAPPERGVMSCFK